MINDPSKVIRQYLSNVHKIDGVHLQCVNNIQQINNRKHIELNVYSVAGVMPQGWNLGGVLGGSKPLA